MNASVYAILILSPLFVLGVLLAWFRGWPPEGHWLIRVGAMVVGVLVASTTLPIFSWSPTPPPLTALAALCIPLALLLIKRLPFAVAATLAFTAIGVANQTFYGSALRNEGVTDYSPAALQSREMMNLRHLCNDLALSGDNPKATYPAGYLDQISDRRVRFTLRELYKGRYKVADWRIMPFWHTRMTHLYHMQTRPTRIWFGGGRLDQDVKAFHVVGVGEFVDGDTVRIPRA